MKVRSILPAACVWALAAHVAGCSGCSCSCAIPTLASSSAPSSSTAATGGPTVALSSASSTSVAIGPSTTTVPAPSVTGFVLGDSGIVLTASTELMQDEMPKVEGPLTPQAVSDTIHQSYLKLRGCQLQAASKDPSAEGLTVVQLQVGPDGTVQGIKPGQGVTATGGLEECVQDQLRGMRFPAANGTSTIDYKLGFKTAPDPVGQPGVMMPPSLKDPKKK